MLAVPLKMAIFDDFWLKNGDNHDFAAIPEHNILPNHAEWVHFGFRTQKYHKKGLTSGAGF